MLPEGEVVAFPTGPDGAHQLDNRTDSDGPLPGRQHPRHARGHRLPRRGQGRRRRAPPAGRRRARVLPRRRRRRLPPRRGAAAARLAGASRLGDHEHHGHHGEGDAAGGEGPDGPSAAGRGRPCAGRARARAGAGRRRRAGRWPASRSRSRAACTATRRRRAARGESADRERAGARGQGGAPPGEPGPLGGHRRAPRLVELRRHRATRAARHESSAAALAALLRLGHEDHLTPPRGPGALQLREGNAPPADGRRRISNHTRVWRAPSRSIPQLSLRLSTRWSPRPPSPSRSRGRTAGTLAEPPSVTTTRTASRPRTSSIRISGLPSARACSTLLETSSPASSSSSRVRSALSAPSRWLASSRARDAGAPTPRASVASQIVAVGTLRPPGALHGEGSLPGRGRSRRRRGWLAGPPGIPGSVLASVLGTSRAAGVEGGGKTRPRGPRSSPRLATGSSRTRVAPSLAVRDARSSAPRGAAGARWPSSDRARRAPAREAQARRRPAPRTASPGRRRSGGAPRRACARRWSR